MITGVVNMDSILEELVQSPEFYTYYKKIEEIIKEEKKKREEFYTIIKEKDKAEFINGEIIIHSPVKLNHNQVLGFLFTIMNIYVNLNNLGYVGIEKILISLTRNDYEPDICFFSKEKSDMFTPAQMKFPSPDLIVEILSESTEKFDRGIKFRDYALHSVEEYWLLDPQEEFVEQYILTDKMYKLKIKSSTGTIKSSVITGFEIPVKSIFDKKENLKVLNNFFYKDIC
jgi:Uma2 family endonuclease